MVLHPHLHPHTNTALAPVHQLVWLYRSQCNARQNPWHGTGGNTIWLHCNTASYLLDPCSCQRAIPDSQIIGVTCAGMSITKLLLPHLGT